VALDKIQVLKAFRETLLDAEVVIIDATGEYRGIRDGDFDAGTMTRPADPDKTPIIANDDLAVIEETFDPNGKSLYMSEALLPAYEDNTANDQVELGGIYQLLVFVPADNGGSADITAMLNAAKYTQDIFDAESANLSITQDTNKGIILDQADIGPSLRADGWLSVPVSISFRTHNQSLAPVSLTAPVASGTGEVGQTLSTTDGTWENTPLGYSYQWQANGVDIAGATSNTYILTIDESGDDVRCVVTATNDGGSASANSNSIAVT